MKKELIRFVFAGLSAVGTDLLSYYLLLTLLPHDLAKGISFCLGTIVAYIINKYWTFEQVQKSYKEMMQFITLYSVTLLVNVGTNKGVLSFFPEAILWAFLMATAVSTVLNFIGQKWWVFKPSG